jgi:uncharacterized delta-60 repeat protein
VLTGFGGVDMSPSDLALQADGRIVVAGDAGLVRYTANGTLDPSFGAGGQALTDFGTALALQADGRIVVAGLAQDAKNKSYFALARYNPDGTLDSSFGRAGKVLTDFGPDAEAHAVALQPDGRIVVAGMRSDGMRAEGFALARYTANGALDPSFGSGGKVLTDFGVDAAATALALQPDGRIVVAGITLVADIDQYDLEYYALARYTGDGGKVLTDFGRSVLSEWPGRMLALQPDGRIVVAGWAGLVRYTGNGALDPAFKAPDLQYGGNAVGLQPDGRIVVAGAVLARYNGDGSSDPSFGSSGDGNVGLSPDFHWPARALALQPDGRIVVAGQMYDTNSQGFTLARYQGR